ncbi:hypothetical protein Acor_36900 [Acrocarpospora corrugata]|uniref:Response regulatory domain-containing protein n=1 Tax=Acrocarpospora corrugata TaxID=35763 RepID=A0A5M3VYN7_9ACTN|nr:response regulator [Acrocarpospora corrugata]GES01626.1 hypothetical protein Acor_36900 [Acrocarpospora corrugata]
MATRRLLIVDDDPAFRTVARALLDGEAFQVAGDAATGSAALAEVVRLRPAVVLLDVQLPDTSGFEVCPALIRAGAAVVLTSVREAADYGPLVERCGARGFIPKRALSAEELTRVLDTV